MKMLLALVGGFALTLSLAAQDVTNAPASNGPVLTSAAPALTNATTEAEGGTNEVTIEDLMKLPAFTNDTGTVLVKVSDKFWVSAYETTQEEYQKITGGNPSKFAGARNPVDTVSWTDAIEYCAKLTEAEAEAKKLPEGFAYTLPTQAQWEGFAQQAELKDAVTSEKGTRSSTAPVGSLGATPPGIYDIRGNVWEWCLDSHDPAWRTARGGAWNEWIDINLRRDFRWYGSPTERKHSAGFRCVLVPKSASN